MEIRLRYLDFGMVKVGGDVGNLMGLPGWVGRWGGWLFGCCCGWPLAQPRSVGRALFACLRWVAATEASLAPSATRASQPRGGL